MRTSGILMVVVDNSAFLVQLGNVRGYLIRGDTIYRLTEDHTVANDLVKRKGMSRSEAAKNPYADVVNRAWGGRLQSDPDTLHVTLEAADRILLCTDGLHRYFRGKDILARSRAHASSESFLAELTDEANRRGGHDNVALVVVDAGVDGEVSPAEPSLDTQFEMMKSVFLFKDLSLQELARVKRIAHCARVRAGEAVIREADIGEDFFILLDGEVRVAKGSKVLTTISVGGHFGELALIDGSRRSADVVAGTDGVLLTIQREDFLRLLKGDKGLGNKLLMNLLRNLSTRVRDLSEHVAIGR
jgi:hypothetical protein